MLCRHKRPAGLFCDAFPPPEGIPNAILYSQIVHDHPIEGDNGIQFELDEPRSLALGLIVRDGHVVDNV